MDAFWNKVQITPQFNEQGVSCYRLDGNYKNKYYIISEAGTRKLMNSPEIVGYDVYRSLLHATSQMLYFLKCKGLIFKANILSILRGALNYPLEEACWNEHIRVHDISFLSCERVFNNKDMTSLDVKYKKLALVDDSTLMIGDIIASGATLIECLRYVIECYRAKGMKLRNVVFFTIGARKGISLLEALTDEIRGYWPDFKGFITIYYEGIFNCYEKGNKGVSGINASDIDFYWKGGIISPEFRRETLSMREALFEKCTIYDGGARRYEIKEHIEEVLEFWKHLLDSADSIDMKALTEEKLGHNLDISYSEWIEDTHYENLDKDLTWWLYNQEKGFISSLEGISLKDMAKKRINTFTSTLTKYIN